MTRGHTSEEEEWRPGHRRHGFGIVESVGEVFTVGHSTRTIDAFVEMLQSHDVEVLWDCRTIPRSRHNPQYEGGALAESLKRSGIGYHHEARLGGLRRPLRDSPNAGWENASFRGYADHMATTEFQDALRDLLAEAKSKNVAVMCAEGNPYRCHRRLIADALCVEGLQPREITGVGKAKSHELTSFAVVDGKQITYPSDPKKASG